MFFIVRSLMVAVVLLPMVAAAQVAVPEISSRSYPDQERWYRSVDTPEFSFEVPASVVRIGFDVSMDAPATPVRRLNDLYETVPLPREELKNGINYINVQFFADEEETEASAVASYRVQLDDVAPTNITADFGEESVYVTAEDSLSGVVMYEVLVNGTSVARIDADSAGTNVLLPGVNEGATIEVKAYDKVGNSASETFRADWAERSGAPTPQAISLETLVALLSMVAVSALLYAIAVRRASRQREEDLKAEVFETKVQIKKIFIALRDEMADQIQALSARKKLTKREEEVLHSLTNALQVSETLIQKEMSDFEGEKKEG